jgi:glycosyltransferase involved in cell wall biosynthesis
MTISVIIPFYNLAKYVKPCLDSVVSATECLKINLPHSIEIICVDDGSTDLTGKILDEYADIVQQQSTASIKMLIIHQLNGGEGAARNAGLAAATGDWVTFLDGDDVWLENHLQVATTLIESNPSADIIALKYKDFNDGSELPEPASADIKTFDISTSIPSEVILEVGVFPTFFRRSFIKDAKFSSLPLGADRLYMAQAFARAKSLIKSDAIVHGYRIRSGSMARAVWNARKVISQSDYAFGSLNALAQCRKNIGFKGHAYLASLWLSDVPNRLSRLAKDERQIAWQHWRSTLNSTCLYSLPRFNLIRKILKFLSFSPLLSIAAARFFRKIGIS